MSDTRLQPDDARALAAAILGAHGAPLAAAELVAAHLVESDLIGMDSHGLMRVPQYVDEIHSGTIVPDAEPRLESQDGALLRVDGGRTFGQVASLFGTDLVAEAARECGIALVTVRQLGHAGRIGAYTERLAQRGLVGLAFVSASLDGHRVAPYGAREGRMATNPIAYAVPTRGAPLAADFSTSTQPEGRIRRMRDDGLAVPAEVLCDADGQPSTDPNDLYADPPGFLLPLGGLAHGHKGSALGILVEVMATLLAGDVPDDRTRSGNNVAILAVRSDAALRDRASTLVDYFHAAAPIDPNRPVQIPGEPEEKRRRQSETLSIDGTTWLKLRALADAVAVELPPVSSPPRGR